jgi:hypothetical protein
MNLVPFFQNVQDFFSAPTFSFALQGAVGYIALVWIFIILWVARDSGNRSDSILFQLISIILVVITTPLIGLPLYLLLRPSQTLFERDMCEMLQYLVEDEEEEEEEESRERDKKPKQEKKGMKQEKTARKKKEKSASRDEDESDEEE